MTDYYAILGVSRNATPLEIRDAYLRLARDTHPDKVKDKDSRKKAEDAFKNVTAAYDTLSRDRSRREYTAKLPPEVQTAMAPAKGPTAAVATPPTTAPTDRPAPGGEAPGTTPGNRAIPTSGRVKFDALGQGIEAFKKKDYHTAVQLLNLAVRNDEGSAMSHAMLGLALAKNPNWIRDALSHMETASKLEPKNVTYLAELALLLHSQGLKLRAKRALETAIAINPGHDDVVRALKEIPLPAPDAETQTPNPAEGPMGLFDRLRKR
jgi:tetratricopeptide (TPR) repeat protein